MGEGLGEGPETSGLSDVGDDQMGHIGTKHF